MEAMDRCRGREDSPIAPFVRTLMPGARRVFGRLSGRSGFGAGRSVGELVTDRLARFRGLPSSSAGEEVGDLRLRDLVLGSV
jgi:hypothetical protein